jgi:serine/threonine protein kinase/Flp pilus assembly protein TadD
MNAPASLREPAASADARLAELIEELTTRLQAGERIDLEACLRDHPEHVERLEKLLPALRMLADVSRSRHAGFASGVTDAVPQLGQLGDFRLLREIGRGGMGVVYEAEQISLGRRVALKVLPFAATVDAKQLQRFKNEAQAAAHLQHPHIVPVHYVGCERGVHFYAMQYVDGQTLAQLIAGLRAEMTEQAKDNAELPATIDRPASEEAGSLGAQHSALGTPPTAPAISTEDSTRPPAFFRTAAQLGLQAALALEHAHQLGIIHRDIKPANLLVAAEPGESTPAVHLWITDFGLAHVQGETKLTMTGDLLGTLRYMSPEQALAKRVIIDHRTDIYSLGATLYELLTLQPAFAGEDRQELLRQIAFEEPKPPRRWDKAIPADLETIVLKALEKNPSDRYATAQELAEDLRCYLEEKPIRARPATVVQKARKWARRNRGVVWSLGLSAALLLAVVVAALAVGIVVVSRKQRDTQLAWQLTRQALDEMSSQVIEDWLSRRGDLEPEQRAFLERALAYYEVFAAESGHSEEVRKSAADAHLRVGKIRDKLGQHGEADAAYRRAQELYASLGADFPTVPEYRLELARSHNKLGLLLKDTGRPKEAEAAYRDALALQKQLTANFPTVPQYGQELARSHNSLGILLATTGRANEAEAAFRDALATCQRLVADFATVPEYGQDLAATHNNLGVLLKDAGRPREAEAAYRNALAIKQRLAIDFPTVPQYRLELARSHNNLGLLLNETGRPKEAEAAYRDALALQKQLAADFPTVPQYRLELARSQNNLGNLLSDTGQAKEAEAAYRDALAVKKKLAADFPTVPQYRLELADNHNNLGVLLKNTGRPKEATAAYRNALAVQKLLAANFPTVPQYRLRLARSHHNLGNLLQGTGRPREAEAAYGDALAILKRLANDFPTVPEYQGELANTLDGLAQLSRDHKDFPLARQLLEQARPRLRAALDANPHHPFYRAVFCDVERDLAATLLDLGEHAAGAEAAANLARLAFEPANDTYKAACLLSRCLPVAKNDAKLPETRRQELAKSYGDRALETLRQAVAKGYRDVAQMRKAPDLDPLRSRTDFQDLLAELEKRH